MLPKAIEVKNSKDALKAMKCAILILVMGVIATIFLIDKVSSSILGLIGSAIIFIPILIIISCILVLRNVPTKIELYPDRAYFTYWLCLSNKPSNIYWTDVTDFQMLGKLKDRLGHTINLVYLSKEQYHIIQEYLNRVIPSQQPQYQQPQQPLHTAVSQLPPGAQPQQIVPSATYHPQTGETERPGQTIKISRRPTTTIFAFSIITILSGILAVGVASGYAFASAVALHVKVVLTILFLIMLILAVFVTYRASKKKELIINQWGVQLKVKDGNEFQYSWNELNNISLFGGGYPYNVHLTFKGYNSSGSVTSHEFLIDDLRKAFNVIRKYADYYNISTKNDLGW